MQNNQNKKELVDEWVNRAKDDEQNVVSILKHRDGTPMMVCFISHQIAEKYLKALILFYSGDYPKVHSLIKLISLIKQYVKTTEDELKEEILTLDPYYIETRYPADIPLEEFNWQMAEEAYGAAVKIKIFVLNKINIV